MKTYHLFLISLCLVLSSCGVLEPASYFGDTLATPTTSVDIYYSAHDVKKDYRVIGHLTCPNTIDSSGKSTSDTVTADALKYN